MACFSALYKGSNHFAFRHPRESSAATLQQHALLRIASYAMSDIDHGLDDLQIDPKLGVVRCCAGSVQYRTDPGKMSCVSRRIYNTVPTKQHEVDRTDQEYLCPAWQM